jgi:hypothetical protein
MNRLWWLALASFVQPVWAPAFGHDAQTHGAHVHGVAALDVAVEGGKLELHLVSPLDSLVGFEHAPRTEAERSALRSLQKTLARPEALLVPTAAAHCSLASSSADVKMRQDPASKEASSGAGKPAPGADEHGELQARYAFRCQQPQALKSIEVRLFETFPRLKRVDVRFAGPRGQKAGRVTPGQRTFAW